MSTNRQIANRIVANLRKELPLPEIDWRRRVKVKNGRLELLSIGARDLIQVEKSLFKIVTLDTLEVGVDVPVSQFMGLPSLSRLTCLKLIFPGRYESCAEADMESGIRPVAESTGVLPKLKELQFCQDLAYFIKV